MSPVRWLTDRRVELARRLLETTELPVDRVAQRAGFGAPTALRQRLHAAIGVAPLTYRRPTVGSAPASLAQVASWRSKRSRRMRWSTYSSPVTLRGTAW